MPFCNFSQTHKTEFIQERIIVRFVKKQHRKRLCIIHDDSLHLSVIIHRKLQVFKYQKYAERRIDNYNADLYGFCVDKLTVLDILEA